MAEGKQTITLGTMVRGYEKTATALDRFIPIGIESVQLHFWEVLPEIADEFWMEEIQRKCEDAGIVLSALGLFANPLKDGEAERKARKDWERIIDLADRFAIPVVSGFTGRKPGTPLSDSFEGVKSFFSPLIDSAIEKGLKLCFENCAMDGDEIAGDWNIAFLPEIWELLFNVFFPHPSVGLEFDPAHLVKLGIPVMKNAENWLPRIHHVHGKDADSIAPHDFCFPGEGSQDWKKLSALLSTGGYGGSIDLEGYHGRFISHEEEVDNQKRSLEFLKSCRRDSRNI